LIINYKLLATNELQANKLAAEDRSCRHEQGRLVKFEYRIGRLH